MTPSAVSAAVEPACIYQNNHWQAVTVTVMDGSKPWQPTATLQPYAGAEQFSRPTDPAWCQQHYTAAVQQPRILPHTGPTSSWEVLGWILVSILVAYAFERVTRP